MRKISILGLLAGCMLLCISPYASEKQATLLKVNAGIGPAIADYIQRGVKQAEKQGSEVIVIQMDTPGGLVKSMREINKVILASRVPVVTFVGPSGARAASAGAFILYASHIAAMAPGTNIGAASPVSIGGGEIGGKKSKKSKSKKDKSTIKTKVMNDSLAYIRSLAQLRGRNAVWAEKAVRDAATLTAKEALKANVIDVIANSVPSLLKKINGRKVRISGTSKVLKTSGITIKEIKPDWRSKLLTVITDPSIAYMLLLAGVYGLFFEFANPGFVLPGVVGAICLVMAMYALQMLPISYAGLALILIGIAFMIGEAFMPSFGALGIGGVIAFIIGSILLMDTQMPAYQIARPLIYAMAAANAAFFVFIIGMAIKARRRQVVSGKEQLVNMIGEAINDIESTGLGRVHGEIWTIETATPVKSGEKFKVIKMKGLTLTVEPHIDEEDNS